MTESHAPLTLDFSKIHIRKEVAKADVPLEFVKLALANLDAAEQLNSSMVEDKWSSNYYRGQTVLWLTYHSTELFLKGFILKLDPNTQLSSHSTLTKLCELLKRLAPDISIDTPFKAEATPPYPELVAKAEKQEKKFHQLLRYPADTAGEPWPGARGFSAVLFQATLKRLRAECELAYDRIFQTT